MSVSQVFLQRLVQANTLKQSFSAILSSLQDGKTGSGNESLAKSNGTPKVTSQISTSSKPQQPTSTMNGVKRKSEDVDGSVARKAVKLSSAPKMKPAAIVNTSAISRAPIDAGLKMKPKTSTSITSAKLAQPGKMSSAVTTSTTNKPRSFASLLQRASAAQEASKAAGVGVIKHKPTERTSKKERLRMIEEAKQNAKHGRSTNVKVANGIKRSIPSSMSNGASTSKLIKRPKQELAYAGTMRAVPTKTLASTSKQKGLGQDKYGGYASWDDLDEAEDEEEEEYWSGSDDMEEAGFDDMEAEEAYAARIAKQEDQEALEEEERHKREKAERKKRLMALSSSAAAARKKY